MNDAERLSQRRSKSCCGGRMSGGVIKKRKGVRGENNYVVRGVDVCEHVYRCVISFPEIARTAPRQNTHPSRKVGERDERYHPMGDICQLRQRTEPHCRNVRCRKRNVTAKRLRLRKGHERTSFDVCRMSSAFRWLSSVYLPKDRPGRVQVRPRPFRSAFLVLRSHRYALNRP